MGNAGEAQALLVQGEFGVSDGFLVTGFRDIDKLPADTAIALPGKRAEFGADLVGQPAVSGREVAVEVATHQHLLLPFGQQVEHLLRGGGEAVPLVLGHVEADGPLREDAEQGQAQQSGSPPPALVSLKPLKEVHVRLG